MSDGEALEELAAAMYHLQKAESVAESVEVKDVLRESLDCLDQRSSDVLQKIGESEYNSDG